MQMLLKSLFTGETKEKPFSFELDLRATEWNGVKPFGSPVQVDGVLKSCTEGVHLSAEAVFDLSVPCDRCAETINKKAKYCFEHQLVRELHDDSNDEYILVEDDTISLDKLITDDILLELPTKNLCKPDCKGLCSVCGTNLNLNSCSCKTKQIDPRLEILGQLLD